MRFPQTRLKDPAGGKQGAIRMEGELTAKGES